MVGMRFSLILLLLLSICTNVYAGDVAVPDNWPWRGFAIESFTDANELKEYLEEIPASAISLQIKPRLRAFRDRIPVSEAISREFSWAHSMLDVCKEYGLVGIIVAYQFPMDPSLQIDQKSMAFWSTTNQVLEMVDFSSRIALEFASRGKELVAYQVQSEPSVHTNDGPKLPPLWESVLPLIIESIRKQDSERWIVVSRTLGGGPTGYDQIAPLNYSKIIYNFHAYIPHRFTHQGLYGYALGAKYPGQIGLSYWDKDKLYEAISPVISFQKKHEALIWVGEFSAARWAEGAEGYLYDLVSIFTENGFGWSYFALGGSHVWNPYYNSEFSEPKNRSLWQKQRLGRKAQRWKTLKLLFEMGG